MNYSLPYSLYNTPLTISSDVIRVIPAFFIFSVCASEVSFAIERVAFSITVVLNPRLCASSALKLTQ